MGTARTNPAPVRCLLVGEYTIGHIPYVDILEQCARERGDVELHVLRLPWAVQGWRARVPGYATNWSVRASVLARCTPAHEWRAAEVALVHTQTSSLLLGRRMRQVPTFVSSDATPANFDEVGEAYQHQVGHPAVERAKRAVLRRAYGGAAGVVAWSSWVERSLVRDYGVPAERVHVVRPGAMLPARRPARPPSDQVRLLFVGGDFARKGGHYLLEAFRALSGPVSLDVVTHSDVPAEERIRVHRGLRPRSAELLSLYEQADIAVLPTLGDASPYAVVEAMAYGLPVVTTNVGAVAEAVEPGTTGLLVPPGDAAALTAALQDLVDRPAHRLELGRRGRERAEQVYDGWRNAQRVLDLLRDTALVGRASATGRQPA